MSDRSENLTLGNLAHRSGTGKISANGETVGNHNVLSLCANNSETV